MQMLDTLIHLVCRTPPPYAEVLWQAGWLLRQLLPYHELKISDSRMSLLNVRTSSAFFVCFQLDLNYQAHYPSIW